jgi:hypothetical protein
MNQGIAALPRRKSRCMDHDQDIVSYAASESIAYGCPHNQGATPPFPYCCVLTHASRLPFMSLVLYRPQSPDCALEDSYEDKQLIPTSMAKISSVFNFLGSRGLAGFTLAMRMSFTRRNSRTSSLIEYTAMACVG